MSYHTEVVFINSKKVVAHFLRDDQIICEVNKPIFTSSILTSSDNWKARVTVDGEESNNSDVFKHYSNNAYTPGLDFFENNDPVVGRESTAGDGWTAWINNDVVDPATSTAESETLAGLITEVNGSCTQPLAIEVKNVATGQVYSGQELVDGFTNCDCTASIYTGLSCAVPPEDAGDFCTADHAVRYYCTNENVVGFAFTNSQTGEFTRQPALYDADGFKFAECETSFITPDGEVIELVNESHSMPNTPNTYDFLRCRMAWSSTPTVGNYVFQFAEELGYSASYQNSFMGSDGKLYNMQVHPIISSVSPATGSTNGGAVITLTGINLGGIDDIRIGGVPCTDVTISNDDGTEATCTSGAQPGTCADGDDPVVGTNCANWESSGNLGSGVDFNGGSVYNYDVNGSPCVEGSTCTGNQPACETIMGYSNFCYVPDCGRYTRKYPGSPGMDYQWVDRTYSPNESINYFGMFADGIETGSKVVSSSHTVSKDLENLSATHYFTSLSSGFFKPPKTGYYSMVVSQCDDECLFQISDVQDMGCPSTLRTRGRSDNFKVYSKGSAERAENHDVFYTQDKILLNSDSQYYINLHHKNGAGNYHANFGYVYHGPDANANADGAPGFTAAEAENMPELHYINEQTDLWAKNTDFVEETQQFVNIVTDDATPFQLLICPSEDTPDADCARTGDITFADFTNQSFEDEIINARGAVCSTIGSMDISNGYYNGYQTNNGASGFLAYHKDSFCGNNKVSGYQPNAEAHVYNMWTGGTYNDENINQFYGQGFSVKKATDACFAVKGSPNQVVFYAEKVDDNDVLRGWWFIHDYSFGANANSWTFVCVDLPAIMLAEMGNQPVWFADPTTHDASDWTLKHMKIRDTTHSNHIFIDEVYIGVKDALFNIQQTSSNVHPGAKAKKIHIESMSNNDHTFTVRMEPTINTCSDGPYTLVRVDVGGTVTKATQLTAQSAGISGSFDVSYNGNTATIKTALLNEWDKNPINNEITNQFGADFSDISVSLNGDCLEGWEVKIGNNLPGDFADMTVDGTNLVGVSGGNIDARVRQRKNGGVMFRSMTSAHLSRAMDTPQVQAWSGDVQAICSSSSACGFTFSDDGLLTLTSITQSNGNGNVVRGDDEFTLNGSGFSDGGQTTQLRNTVTGSVYEMTDITVNANGETLLGKCATCPAGSYMVSVQNTVGRSAELPLTIQEDIVNVECATVTTGASGATECNRKYDTGVHVGSQLTLTGFGFTEASRVKIGAADCLVKSQTLTEIKCIVLPGQTASSLSVTINGSSESGNNSIRVYDQYAEGATDRVNTCTLNSSASLAPGQANTVEFTCNWNVGGSFIPTNGIYKVTMINDATGVHYNYDSSAVSAANEQASFTTGVLPVGTYTLVFRDSDFSIDGHPAIHYAYILYSTSVSVESSVSGVTGNSGSQLGGGVLTVSGVNVENVDVTVGGQPCSNIMSSGFTCLVPAHTDFVKDMNINANSVDSGTFSPATLTINKGTRVNFNWNVFLVDQTMPTFQIKSGDHFTLSTQEGNQGSQFFTFMTPGTYMITTGPYDGINEIIGTVMVQDTSASNTAAIEVSKDGQSLFSGTYTYSFADISTYDAVVVAGGSVTVANGGTNPVYINDGSCSMTAGSCDLNATPGSYNAVVGNMNPLTSDSDDVTIARAITSITTVNTFGSVSNLGGGTVHISGNNLNGISTVTIAGCNADFTWSSDVIHATMPVGCAGLATSATQVDIAADEATATLSLTVSADGHGTYALTQTSSTIQFTVENVSVVSAGTYTPMASFYADGVFTHADCTANTLMIGMSVATATCTFASQPTSTGSFMVGIDGFGYGAEFANSVFTPRASALLTSADQPLNEGSHYGGLELKVTGTHIVDGTTLKYMVNGADLCASNACNQAVSDGAMTFTVPASGFTSGDAIAVVKLVGSDGRESSQTDEETAKFTHRDSLTPSVSSAVKTATTLRIDLATGMNADCSLMTATVGGQDCPQVTCSNTRRNGLFISCIVPPLVAGSHTVVVTNPDTGSSNSDITMEQTLVLGSISPSTSGLAGGQYLTISGEGMDPTTATVEILCTGLAAVACPINTNLSTASSVLCTIPTQASAVTCNIEYDSGSTRRRRSTRTSLGSLSFVEQSATLISVTSSNQASCGVCGGTAGGTVLTITGTGFNNGDSPANEVTIDGSACIVSSATTTEIVCSTTAHSGSNSYDILVNVVGTGIAVGTDIPQFRYVNLWSSPATWGCSSGTFEECAGAPNADGHAVEIGPGNEILLDVSTPVLSLLLIREGALVWDINQPNLQLNAEYILIVGGSFTLGTEAAPLPPQNKATIKLYGHQRSIHLPIYGAKCFAVRSGTVDIHGAEVNPTWTFLDTTAEAGTDTIDIQTPNGFTGWNIGDRVAIAPTGDEKSILQSEDFTILNITPNADGTVQSIQLSGQLQFTHSGVETTFGDYTLQQRAEVGLLSRNIKFEGNFNDAAWLTGITQPECDSQGVEFDLGLDETQNCFVDRFNDEEGSDKFGAHMLFHNVEYAKVEYMEIHNCGQASELGRYPIHFHNSYDQPNSYLRGLGIWQTYNRAMTLHAVNNAVFEKNVAYNNMGHAYFMEDGVEHGNVVRYNLAIKTKIAPSLLSVDQTPAGFWIVNTNNEYYGNHAAGAAGFGFWVNPPLHSTGSNVDENFCPREIPIKKFENNVAHSCGVYGMWIFEDYNPRKNNWNGECNSQAGLAGADHPMDGFVAWGNFRGVEFSMGSGLHMNNFVGADNTKSNLAVKENHLTDNFEVDSTSFNNAIVIGRSNTPGRTGCTAFGIETPWKKGSFIVNGAKFYNFDDTNNNNCYGIDYCYSSYPFDCGRISLWSGIEWNTSPKKGKFDWKYETVLWDLDGTLSGSGVANTKIVPSTPLYSAHCSDISGDNTGFNLGVQAMQCTSDAYFHRISIEDIEPESLNSVNLVVNNGNEDRVPWREKRGDDGRAWMYMNMMDTTSDLHFDTFPNHPNITFALKTYYDYAGHYSNLKFSLLNAPDLLTGLAGDIGQVPVLGDTNYGYFIDSSNGGDVYIHLQEGDAEVADTLSAFGGVEEMRFEMKKCWYPNCIVPDAGNPTPPDASDIVTCNWSDTACWPDGVVPGLNEASRANVTIVTDRHVMIDVADLYLDNLFVEGTLELDQSVADAFTISVNSILVNTGYGGVDTFSTIQTLNAAAASDDGGNRSTRLTNENSLPQWQFGRLLIGTESSPIACDKTVTISMTGDDATARAGWGAMDGSVAVGNKTIASFGRLSLVGCGSATNYITLLNNAAAGSNFIDVEGTVPTDWVVNSQVVVGASGAAETESEVMTISAVSGSRITFTTNLAFAHAGSADNAVAGVTGAYANAAEVGLLTRNIKIDGTVTSGDSRFGGRVLVASAPMSAIFRQGHATISNVEFIGMGQYGMTSLRDPRFALAFWGIEDASGMTSSSGNHANGNAYQPAGYEIGASYVQNCAFHSLYGVAIGANGANNIVISNNVVTGAIDDGIKLGYLTGATIDHNMVAGVMDNVFVGSPPLWTTQANFDFDGIYMPAGIRTNEEALVASMKNNAVSGIQGAAYSTWGEACTEAEINTSTSTSTAYANNIGRSSVYGHRILFTQADSTCTRFGGFKLTNMMACGFCSIVGSLHAIVENIEVQDTPVGIYFNDYGVQAVSHVAEDKTRTVKNSLFIGATAPYIARNCNRDYLFNSAGATEGQMMQMWNNEASSHLNKQFISETKVSS